ncbi:MAG: hypothetical protein K0Q78_448 [Cellvibrio sp.]|jgi:hypothetical protein|nr:hypothetical protein [Cellvibrio sp.]
MNPNQLTYTKEQAESFLKLNRRPNQIYMKRFDAEVVFRRGKIDDTQIDKVRYKEDSRPERIFNKTLGRDIDKKSDIITYKPNGKNELYVLARSGGISLFDGISSKVKLGQKDCWWVITKNAKVEDGLIIAKDVFKDAEGNTHYSIEADRDMPVSEYLEKVGKLKQYMKRF